MTARPPLGLIASPAKTSGGIVFSDGERTASSRLEKGARGGSEERENYSTDIKCLQLVQLVLSQ